MSVSVNMEATMQTNITTQTSEVENGNNEEPEDQFCRNVILMYFSLKVVISFFGMICNVLTIYIFFTDRKRVSLVYNIIGLALADCFVLVAIDSNAGVEHFVDPNSMTYFPQFIGFFRSFEEHVRLINVWMTVCICYERYRVICKSAIIDINTRKYVFMRMGLVVILSTAFSLPEYVDVETFAFFTKVAKFYGIFYELILFYLLQLIIPTILLIYFTYYLRKSVIGDEDSIVQGSIQHKIALTKSLIAIIIIFIIANSIDPLITIHREIEGIRTSRTDCYSFYTNFRYVSEILIIVNCSANFFVYLYFNRRFNTKFKSLITFKDKGNSVGPMTVSTTNSEMI